MRLWDSLAGSDGAERVLEDYLLLAREAVGLQYLPASEPGDLTPGLGRSFLGEALCDAAPRLLARLPPPERARVLAQLWNVGERLVSRASWLNRYLAARLRELDDLSRFEEFLARVVGEGLDEGPASSWEGPYEAVVVDTAVADPAFLPGLMHLATPSIVCVHDRRHDGRHVALLLRSKAKGGAACLGSTPCLVEAGEAAAHALTARQRQEVVAAAGVEDPLEVIASRTGFAAMASQLSQRIRVVESRS